MGYEEERAGSVWLAVDVAIPAVIGRFGNHAAESRTLWTVRQQLNTQVPVQDGNKRARMHPMKPYTLTVSYCTYPWFKAMTKTHVFKTSVRVWTNGVCVKHARKNSLQRRSLFSLANHSTAAHAKKTQSDTSVTHMGPALHHASLPKLLQGHETRPKNAKRDTEEQV